MHVARPKTSMFQENDEKAKDKNSSKPIFDLQ